MTQTFIQYALAVGNDKPGRTGNVGMSDDRDRLIASNRGGLYANNPHTLWGQVGQNSRKLSSWVVIERFEHLRAE